MSCYNWESGNIVIPKRAYYGFKTAIIREHNRLEEERLLRIKSYVIKLKQATHNTRGENRKRLLAESAERLLPHEYNHPDVNIALECFNLKRSPQRKDVDFLPVRTSHYLQIDEWSLSFNDDRHVVRWCITENNHAVERSNSQPLAVFTKQLLAKMKWTRRTGGLLIGNDEYNRDVRDYEEANYVTVSYGPLGSL